MKTLCNVATRRLATLLALTSLACLAGACETQSDTTERAEGAAASGSFALPEVDVSGLPEGVRRQLRRSRENVRRSPRDPDQLGALGAIYYVHGFPEAAAACFARAKELAPRSLHWWYYLALACERTGERQKAISAYEQAIELNANYGPFYVRLAGLLVDSDRQRAARLYRRARELNPKDPTAILGLGLCEAAGGDMTAALRQIETALQINPTYREAHAAMARVLTNLKREEEARRHRAAAVRGKTPVIDDQLFEALLRNGLLLDILLYDALLLAQNGVFEQAEQALAKAREVDRTGIDTRRTTAMVRVMQGRLEEAAEHFRRVLEARPDALDVQARLADVQARLGRYAEAEAGFRVVLERNPEDGYTLERYCDLLMKLERAEEAETLLWEAPARHPTNPLIRLQLGIALFNLKKDGEAREQFQACLDMSPDRARARYFLGRLAQRGGDLAGAKRHWERIIETTPHSLEAYLALAETAMHERDFATAERYMRDGLKQAPYSAGLANGLAWILATSPDESQRNGEEAVRFAENACANTQRRQHEFLDTLAAAYAEAARFDDAVKTAREAVRLAEEARDEEAAAEYRRRLALYEKKQPYRDTE
ncbi:MAG: tetratricopeptide repeat protein [Phycisphaerae bacterium]